MTTVAMLGAFDTKASEFEFLKTELMRRGADVFAVDFGVHDDSPAWADVPSSTVARMGGAELGELLRARDRGSAMQAMADGVAAVFRNLGDTEIDAAISLGGTGGTAVASAAFRQLPLGIPKLIVSTAASGNTAPYIGESDLILVPSITDVAGLNSILRGVIERSAASIVAQATGSSGRPEKASSTIAASMFGVTTPCVDRARGRLEADGAEVVVFHMTGTGGRMMERLIREGWVDAVLDLTTTELADELVGGVFSAGSDRLSAAAVGGVPQVVSVGALDMVNFGPVDTVPSQFASRLLYQHNPSVTLMRTTTEECAELGRRLAHRLNAAVGATTLLLPLKGVSMLSVAGAPFADQAADDALFGAIRSELDRSRVELIELDCDINAPEFADGAVSALAENMARSRTPAA